MPNSDYHRRQADMLMRLAETVSDSGAARHLRAMAADQSDGQRITLRSRTNTQCFPCRRLLQLKRPERQARQPSTVSWDKQLTRQLVLDDGQPL